jgi:1,4-alpha-glucan branching enzyme
VSPGTYRLILNSDAPEFGGHDIVQGEQTYESFSFNDGENDRNQISTYIPSRTGIILERI